MGNKFGAESRYLPLVPRWTRLVVRRRWLLLMCRRPRSRLLGIGPPPPGTGSALGNILLFFRLFSCMAVQFMNYLYCRVISFFLFSPYLLTALITSYTMTLLILVSVLVSWVSKGSLFLLLGRPYICHFLVSFGFVLVVFGCSSAPGWQKQWTAVMKASCL